MNTAPANFTVTQEYGATPEASTCPLCNLYPTSVMLFFGYSDDKLLISSLACSPACARLNLWKRYCISRLRGSVTQEQFKRDEECHGCD